MEGKGHISWEKYNFVVIHPFLPKIFAMIYEFCPVSDAVLQSRLVVLNLSLP